MERQGHHGQVDWQGPAATSPRLAALLSDAELAMRLYEDELAQWSDCERGPLPATNGQENTTKECQICFDRRHTDLFPPTTAASGCSCLSDACLVCVQEHIRTQMGSKEWREGSMTCPMCNRALTYREMEDLADSETLARHVAHTLNRTVDDMPDFVRCPACPSGQVHDAPRLPVAVCAACRTTFCLRHRLPLPGQQQQQPPPPPAAAAAAAVAPAPSPHDDMSCDEYDAFLADPVGFRSAHEREAARADRERREAECVARARARVDRILRERRRRRGHGGASASPSPSPSSAEVARAREDGARRARAARERARLDGERRRADAGRRRAAEEAARRGAEEARSEATVARTTKACPRCGARIEKNEGCMHMTCSCRHEFCWECLGAWVNGACVNCFGGATVQFY